MIRSTGVLVAMLAAMLALAGTAMADKTPAKKAPAPATGKDAKGAKDADKPDPKADAPAEGSGQADEADAMPPHITGPQHVDLGHQAAVDLPEGFILLERTEAKKVLERGGDPADEVVAVIAKLDSTWMIRIDYADVGYVTDSDADDLDANELFNNYKEGNADQNKRRRQLGVPDLVLDDWSQRPHYAKAQHQLLWGLKGHSIKDGQTDVFINDFTRLLGRNGYLSVDLVDSPDRIPKAKAEAASVMSAIKFATGARYEDHKSEDKSSGIGLRALVLGGAGVAVVAKGGWFIGLLLALKKGVIVIVLAIGAFFKKIFGRKKPPSDPPPPTAPNV